MEVLFMSLEPKAQTEAWQRDEGCSDTVKHQLACILDSSWICAATQRNATAKATQGKELPVQIGSLAD